MSAHDPAELAAARPDFAAIAAWMPPLTPVSGAGTFTGVCSLVDQVTVGNEPLPLPRTTFRPPAS